jgi:FixJ family two-component response regulator
VAEDRGLVFVVDDDQSVRDALEGLLQSAGWRVETFATSDEFLARPPSEEATCLVLDIELPGTGGLELQDELARIGGDIPIVFITGHGDVSRSVRAMKAGAVEFLVKPFSDVALLDGIERAIERSKELLVRKAELALLNERYAKLSARERQVMQLVITGLMNKEIAHELGTREVTVKVQRGKVMRKMHAQSLPDLVRMAEKLGIPAGRGDER